MSSSSIARFSAAAFGDALGQHRRQRDIVEDAFVRKQIEVLEDHADLLAHRLQMPLICGN
jgi:cytochrome P450